MTRATPATNSTTRRMSLLPPAGGLRLWVGRPRNSRRSPKLPLRKGSVASLSWAGALFCEGAPFLPSPSGARAFRGLSRSFFSGGLRQHRQGLPAGWAKRKGAGEDLGAAVGAVFHRQSLLRSGLLQAPILDSTILAWDSFLVIGGECAIFLPFCFHPIRPYYSSMGFFPCHRRGVRHFSAILFSSNSSCGVS